ncbi:MAG: hypothetical protein WC436_05760 [Candidatus Babeliales bacterium]
MCKNKFLILILVLTCISLQAQIFGKVDSINYLKKNMGDIKKSNEKNINQQKTENSITADLNYLDNILKTMQQNISEYISGSKLMSQELINQYLKTLGILNTQCDKTVSKISKMLETTQKIKEKIKNLSEKINSMQKKIDEELATQLQQEE